MADNIEEYMMIQLLTFKKMRKFLLVCAAACLYSGAAMAQLLLPESVSQALQKAGIDQKDVAIVVVDAEPGGKSWLLHNEQAMMNPASVIKLVTTYAALDILGPGYTWKTGVFADGPVENGVLQGSLYIRGSGDPSMTADRLRDLLLEVRAAGIQNIRDNLVIDRSVYAIPEVAPGAFDGEPFRPYNVRPDALLVNYKSIVLIFNPSLATAGGQIPIVSDPPLTGVQLDSHVTVGDQRQCGDWQKTLSADFSDPLHIRIKGTFPLVCGNKRWYVAYAEPSSYALRVTGGLWQQLGGDVQGRVTTGTVPPGARLVAVGESKSMAEVVRDVNKFSNNVMAQSVFLALALPDQKGLLSSAAVSSPATLEQARQRVAAWWSQQLPRLTPPVMDNGSGLSRSESIAAISLAGMLQSVWHSAVMPEYVSSLPIAGVDGTMRRSNAQASAHIKTGSMNGVVARAGYVVGNNGQRRVIVFLINSPKSYAAKEALDALIDWSASF
ncbi:D-alanyl-D-alanine carboxypeptidase/D-alanyl-D-alanine endopeptidase [Saezia sanguinis]|uniref:D-alanyl-D-alanine carboxypeptidase/D-alanyl-D-alanine endopeptidase n=1 Tax=Saezia sanguinis TaxID=1965230 RepID=UPI0030DC19E7